MNAQSLIPTLLFVAALALLPPWLVGGAALGAAAALWGHRKLLKARQAAARAAAAARELERSERQLQAFHEKSVGPEPKVVQLRPRSRP